MLSPRGAARPEVRALARYLAGADAARTRREVARSVTRPASTSAAEATRWSRPSPARPSWRSRPRRRRRCARCGSRRCRRSARCCAGDADPADALAEAKHRFDDVRRPPPPPAAPWPGLLVLGARRAGSGRSASCSAARNPALRAAAAPLAAGVPLRGSCGAGGRGAGLAAADGGRGHRSVRRLGRRAPLRRDSPTSSTSSPPAGGRCSRHGSFYLVLLVTVAWTVINVVFHLGSGWRRPAAGPPLLRLRAIYRVLLIVPWAVPNYVTALAWKGMFHRQFGAVTGLIHRINDAARDRDRADRLVRAVLDGVHGQRRHQRVARVSRS